MASNIEHWSDQKAFIKGLGVDQSGNAYVAGEFLDTLALPGVSFVAEGSDLFLLSLNEAGELRWAEQIGGPKSEFITGIGETEGLFATDKTGSSYIGGSFGQGTRFGRGQENQVELERRAIAVAKFDSQGEIQWVRTDQDGGLDVFGDAAPTRIAVAPDGSLAVAWYMTDTGGASTVVVGDTTLVDPGFGGAFVTLYSPGGDLEWVRQLKSYGNEIVETLEVDRSGNVYVGGTFDGLELQIGSARLRKNDLQIDDYDGFVGVFGKQGETLWTLHVPGPGVQWVDEVAVSDDGDVIVAGEFRDPLTLGDSMMAVIGYVDAFIARYSSSTVLGASLESPQSHHRSFRPSYPNPAGLFVHLPISLDSPAQVRVDIFDVLGRRVATLADAYMTGGDHVVDWDVTGVAPGTYVGRLAVDGVEENRLLTIVK